MGLIKKLPSPAIYVAGLVSDVITRYVLVSLTLEQYLLVAGLMSM